MNLIGQGPRIVLHPSSATLTVMARTYRLPPRRRTLNRLVRVLLSIGLGPPRTYLLTVRGRRSGRLYSTPVTLVEDGGLRWLVAPYGDVAWARNAKAAGEVAPAWASESRQPRKGPADGTTAGRPDSPGLYISSSAQLFFLVCVSKSGSRPTLG